MRRALLAIALVLPLAARAEEAAKPAPEDAEKIRLFASSLLDGGDPYRAALEFQRYLHYCGGCENAALAQLQLGEAWRRAGSPALAAASDRALAGSEKPEAKEAAKAVALDLELSGKPAEASDAHRAFAERFAGDAAAPDEAALAIRLALRAHDPDRVGRALAVPGAALPKVRSIDGAVADARRASRRSRSPAAAGILAAVLPGAGHAYAGEWKNAFAAFLTNALFAGGAGYAASKREWAVAGVAGGFELFWYGGNIVGAVNAADRSNARMEERRFHELEQTWFPSGASGAPGRSLSLGFVF